MDKSGVQPTPINSVFLSVNGPEKKGSLGEFRLLHYF